jgi:HlyD family secretion protein
MPISRKRKVIIGSVVGLLMVVILAVSMMAGNREAPEVITEKVKKEPLLESKVTASGEVRPVKLYNLTAEVAGRITNIYIREGDLVKKGQPLLKVDPTQVAEDVAGATAGLNQTQADLSQQQVAISSAENNVFAMQAQLNSAEADLQRMKADLMLAEANYKRNQQLLENGVIPRATFDQVESSFLAAKASVESQEARIIQMRTQVKDAQIRVDSQKAGLRSSQARVAQVQSSLRKTQDLLYKTVKYSPIDGVVSSLPVKEGEFALASFSTTPLMTIADMSEVNVEVKVDETDIANVKVGQPVKVKVDALGEQEIDGTVTEVGSSAITRSGQTIAQTTGSQEAKDFKVVVKLTPDDETRNRLRPGMSATSVIRTDRRENVVVVPLQALVLQDAEQTGDEAAAGKPKEVQGVFKLDGTKVTFVPVTTGITGDTDIEVTSGLTEDDEIVTGPFKELRNLKTNTVVKRAPANGRDGKDAGNATK